MKKAIGKYLHGTDGEGVWLSSMSKKYVVRMKNEQPNKGKIPFISVAQFDLERDALHYYEQLKNK